MGSFDYKKGWFPWTSPNNRRLRHSHLQWDESCVLRQLNLDKTALYTFVFQLKKGEWGGDCQNGYNTIVTYSFMFSARILKCTHTCAACESLQLLLKSRVLGHHLHGPSYTFPLLLAEWRAVTLRQQDFPTSAHTTDFCIGREHLHMASSRSVLSGPIYLFMLSTHIVTKDIRMS